MASEHPSGEGIRFNFLARHTTDTTLLRAPQNNEYLFEREERESREIGRREREASEVREREQREREARERELRARRERQERQRRERETREVREQGMLQRNREELRLRWIQRERIPIRESFYWQCQCNEL